MKQILSLGCAALCAILISACGGGGSPAFIQAAGTLMTPFPIQSPTQTPIVAPSPSSAPAMATPVPLSQRAIAGAPLSATISQLSRIRTQAKTQAQGTMNGLPILVESSGQIAAWAGDQAVWTQAVGTSTDVAETGLTITPSGNLPLNNPAPAPISCLGSVSAMCAVHPLAWTFGTSSANGKPVGKQTLTVTFADGTTGTTFDYVYDGWTLPCNAGFAYVGGVPVAQATRATSDVYADCVAGNIVFPKSAILYSNPVQDQYGRTETIFPIVTAQIFISSGIVNVPMTSIAHGTVYGITTQDGAMAKVYFDGASATTTTASSGMSLHSNLDLTYSF